MTTKDATPLTRLVGRYMTWEHEPPQPGETPRERSARIHRNSVARGEASRYNGALCKCGHVRANVVHATNPAEEPEGAAYYEGWEQHPFEPDEG